MAELRRSDMFVLLSDFEGLPLSLVEAMAAGCVPIVANMESGIPELITHHHNGLIQQSRDYAQWADTIINLHNDTKRLDTLAKNAQQTIRTTYTTERIGQQFHELFTRIARELHAGGTKRPPALRLGAGLAQFGDVLPPPAMHRAVPFAGM
jgi:glycosyltransferase involved in cell wall biosynthesis